MSIDIHAEYTRLCAELDEHTGSYEAIGNAITELTIQAQCTKRDLADMAIETIAPNNVDTVLKGREQVECEFTEALMAGLRQNAEQSIELTRLKSRLVITGAKMNNTKEKLRALASIAHACFDTYGSIAQSAEAVTL